MTAPISGASQNNQSCISAQSWTNNAGPVDLAGLTERFVTGMPIKWINVRPSPMAIGANPAGAHESVVPRMIIRNMNVSTTSATKHASNEYCPGECSP